MVHIVLVRHGESRANAAGILAGRLPGYELTDSGRQQIAALARALPFRRIARIEHSSVLRCVQTTEVLLDRLEATEVAPSEAFVEVDYGTWSGTLLAELKDRPEWKQVVSTPSTMVFPQGESLAEAAARAVAGLSGLVDRLFALEEAGHAHRTATAASSGAGEAERPEPVVGVIVAHGDIIKAMLAHVLTVELDEFQRIAVAPGSYSVVSYPDRDSPTVTAMSVVADHRLAQARMPGGGH